MIFFFCESVLVWNTKMKFDKNMKQDSPLSTGAFFALRMTTMHSSTHRNVDS